MGLKIDWHVHTLEGSNESEPAAEVVRKAKEAGLYGICISDHNSTKAIDAAASLAGDNLIIIPGAELDAVAGRDRVHILCVNPDYRDPGFQEGLSNLNKIRERRMIDSIKKLEEKSVLPNGGAERVMESLKRFGSPITRIVVMNTIIGLYRDSDESIGTLMRNLEDDGRDLSLLSKMIYKILDKRSDPSISGYIGYDAKYAADYRDVIDMCVKSRGVCGFAHLAADIKDRGLAKEIFDESVDRGAMMLGIRHKNHSSDDVSFLEQLAKSRKVSYRGITGDIVMIDGTDYHAKKEEPALGAISSPADTLEQVRYYIEKLREEI